MSRYESTSEAHFDSIAKDYDHYKKKNRYYYNTIKKILKKLITEPRNSSILEVGCGTGDILHSLKPGTGLGVDASIKMVSQAKKKYGGEKNLSFLVGRAEELELESIYDYIVMVDLLEHLDDVGKTLTSLNKIANHKTKIIIITPNHMWSQILYVLEKLRLKMPEGPHSFISLKNIRKTLEEKGFEVVEDGYRLILPLNIPVISETVNNLFYKIPPLKKLGLIQYSVSKKLEVSST